MIFGDEQFVAPAEEGEGWTAQYEADALPENATPAWTAEHEPIPLENSTVEINPAGKLHVSALLGNPELVSWSITPEFSETIGLTVEFKVQMVLGDVLANSLVETYVYINTGEHLFALNIYTDGITNYFDETLYEMDTTDDYHIYRFIMQDGVGKLYIDGVLRATENDPLEDTSPKRIKLFAFPGAVDAEQLWDYIYWKTDGAVAP